MDYSGDDFYDDDVTSGIVDPIVSDDVTIEVSRVYIPAWSSIGYAEGYRADGAYVEMAGDHRMIRNIGDALTGDEPVYANAPAYMVRTIEEPQS